MNRRTGYPGTEFTSPICIFGSPRFGTTWLGKIFDSHPATLYRHEPDSGSALQDVPVHAVPDPDSESARRLKAFLAELPTQRSLKVCGKLPLFPKRYLSGWRGAVHRSSVYSAKIASSWLQLPILEPVDRKHGTPRPVWKSIESTGRAGLVARLDSGIRVFLLVRHPCGQIDSTLRGEADRRFTDDCPSADDWGIFERLLETPQAQRRGLSLDQLRGCSAVERLAWRWLLFNEKAMEELQGLPNARVIRYESLCERPMETAGELLEFAGLEWEPAVEAFLTRSSQRDDGRYYSVNRDPLAAANGWRERLDRPTIESIRAVVAGSEPGALFEQSFADSEPGQA